jgi:hypothetical protein
MELRRGGSRVDMQVLGGFFRAWSVFTLTVRVAVTLKKTPDFSMFTL